MPERFRIGVIFFEKNAIRVLPVGLKRLAVDGLEYPGARNELSVFLVATV